jgi:hypothetical protein
MDAAVVLLGYLDLANFGNYSAIRSVRVLRPLRTITKVEGMRVSGPAGAHGATWHLPYTASCWLALWLCWCVMHANTLTRGGHCSNVPMKL